MAEHPGKYALRQLLDEYQGLFPSAAQQVNDYVAELEARLEERDCDMHARIRANYDKTVADCWRAKVAELEAQVAGGAGLIAAERQRQVSEEGWTPEHDDEHIDGYLAIAAAHLCCGFSDRWGLYDKHRHNRQRQLVIAGALIAAELDRLARTAPKEGA